MSFIKKLIGAPAVWVSQEEMATIIKALERSAAAMPEPTETFASRDMRAGRETRLAKNLTVRLGASIV